MFPHKSVGVQTTRSHLQMVPYSLHASHIQNMVSYFDRDHYIATNVDDKNPPHHETHDRSKNKRKGQTLIQNIHLHFVLTNPFCINKLQHTHFLNDFLFIHFCFLELLLASELLRCSSLKCINSILQQSQPASKPESKSNSKLKFQILV